MAPVSARTRAARRSASTRVGGDSADALHDAIPSLEGRASAFSSPSFSTRWFVVESGLFAGVWTVDSAGELHDLEDAAQDASIAGFGSGGQGEIRARTHWRALCDVNAQRALCGLPALSCGLLDAAVFERFHELHSGIRVCIGERKHSLVSVFVQR